MKKVPDTFFRGVLAVMTISLVGCQGSIDAEQLTATAQRVERSDLDDTLLLEEVAARIAPPRDWTQRPTQRRSIATHIQFRSPDQTVRMGVVKLAMPLPLSADTIIWLARTGYKSKNGKPQLLTRWTDDAGRHWLVGQDDAWQGEAYILTAGFRGWIVYRSWKRDPLPSEAERDKASRAVRTVVPMLDD
ncbi:MAG: hypothetical protein AAGD32_02730 [Planctomycetota bacterium]